jgi:hypothetical protein
MKTTKRDFAAFKKAFLRWQRDLNRQEYTAYFEHCPLKNDAVANLSTNHRGKVCVARLATSNSLDREDFDAESIGKHEAIHLLIGRLSWLGSCRFLADDEIGEEDEAVVSVLERVL